MRTRSQSSDLKALVKAAIKTMKEGSHTTALAGMAAGAATTMLMGSVGFFDGFYLPAIYFGENLAPLRIGMVTGSGALGFGLGWMVSPAAKGLRTFVGSVLAGASLVAIIADQGPIGWGIASAASWITFSAGLGYWLRKFVSRLTQIPTTFGSAAWATFKEMVQFGLLAKIGIRLGFAADEEGQLHTLVYAGDRHMLTIAPNRSGKGTCIIIPNLLTYKGSMVVIDPKGENAMITAKHRALKGQKVFVFDPWHITGMETARFNPLDWLKAGDVDIGDKAMLLADAMIMSSSDNERFWDEEAKALLVGLLLFVALDPSQKEERHLGQVRDLLLLDGEELAKLFKRMIGSPHPMVRSAGARCLQKEEKLLSNVMASLQAQTHFLDSTRLRDSLSRSDFDFADLKHEAMTIYVVMPSDKLSSHGRAPRLLIQQALSVNVSNIEKKPKHSVLFVLDEMPALGKLSMVEDTFGLMAGYGIQIHAVAQDASQLKRIYGDGWESFVSNAGVIQYFGSRDSFTAEYFSKLCGVTTVWNFSTAVARAFGVTHGKDVSHSETTTATDTATGTQRNLAYADELMRLPEGQQLILAGNMNPIIARKVPWFEDADLKGLGVNLHTKEQEGASA